MPSRLIVFCMARSVFRELGKCAARCAWQIASLPHIVRVAEKAATAFGLGGVVFRRRVQDI